MKELSKELIEIDGKEYELFLNRKGIVAYEKYVKDEVTQIQDIPNKYQEVVKDLENVEIKDDTNPFENIEMYEEVINKDDIYTKMYIKLYWIMLYTNYQLSLKNVEELYNKACKEYGENQVRALADQMVDEVNVAPKNVNNENLKNLKALKPKK